MKAPGISTSEALAPARLWTTLVLLSLANVVGYIDRLNLSVAIALPEFATSFNLTDHERGLLNSAFWWTYALFQVPAGMVVDRYGSKYPLAICFLLWSLTCAASGLATSIVQLFLLRLLLGACEAMVVPAALRWVRFNVPKERHGLAFGVYTTGSKVGAIVGIPLATFLAGLWGWRGMFVAMGLGFLIWMIPWHLVVRSDFRRSARTSDSSPSIQPLTFAVLLSSPAIVGTIIGAFCYSYALLFYFTWMPSYFVKRLNLSVETMSLYSTVSFTGLTIVAFLAGYWRDRLVRSGRNAANVSRNLIVAGLFLGGVLQVSGAFSTSTGVALFFSVASLYCLGLATVNSLTLTQLLVPASTIGRTAAMQNCASSVGGIAVSIVSGWLLQTTGSYVAPIIAIFVFLMLGAAIYHFLVRENFSPIAKAVASPVTSVGR